MQMMKRRKPRRTTTEKSERRRQSAEAKWRRTSNTICAKLWRKRPRQ